MEMSSRMQRDRIFTAYLARWALGMSRAHLTMDLNYDGILFGRQCANSDPRMARRCDRSVQYAAVEPVLEVGYSAQHRSASGGTPAEVALLQRIQQRFIDWWCATSSQNGTLAKRQAVREGGGVPGAVRTPTASRPVGQCAARGRWRPAGVGPLRGAAQRTQAGPLRAAQAAAGQSHRSAHEHADQGHGAVQADGLQPVLPGDGLLRESLQLLCPGLQRGFHAGFETWTRDRRPRNSGALQRRPHCGFRGRRGGAHHDAPTQLASAGAARVRLLQFGVVPQRHPGRLGPVARPPASRKVGGASRVRPVSSVLAASRGASRRTLLPDAPGLGLGSLALPGQREPGPCAQEPTIQRISRSSSAAQTVPSRGCLRVGSFHALDQALPLLRGTRGSGMHYGGLAPAGCREAAGASPRLIIGTRARTSVCQRNAAALHDRQPGRLSRPRTRESKCCGASVNNHGLHALYFHRLCVMTFRLRGMTVSSWHLAAAELARSQPSLAVCSSGKLCMLVRSAARELVVVSCYTVFLCKNSAYLTYSAKVLSAASLGGTSFYIKIKTISMLHGALVQCIYMLAA